MRRGLNEVPPGRFATAIPAERARRLTRVREHLESGGGLQEGTEAVARVTSEQEGADTKEATTTESLRVWEKMSK